MVLITSVPSTALAASIKLPHGNLAHSEHVTDIARDTISIVLQSDLSCNATPCYDFSRLNTLDCAAADGSTITSENSVWEFICDTDVYAQDVLPFRLAGSFADCMHYCEDLNRNNDIDSCTGFVYAPARQHSENDCYLKKDVSNRVRSAGVHLLGAILRATISTTITPITPTTALRHDPLMPQIMPDLADTIPTLPIAGSQSSQPSSDIRKSLGVVNSNFLGTSTNEAAFQYVSHALAKPVQMASSLLEAGINIDLITEYPLASDTGSWTSNDASGYQLATMTVTPRLSRDGGRGGNINGTNVFIFCDTSTYGKDKDPMLGYLNGFVSSSVAVDESMNGLNGKPLSLVNSLGQWQDDVGRMRGWVPMTTGEESFNIAVSGQGYRYAVWPNSSPIKLNSTHAVIYAPLVYLEVDMHDQSSPRYTSLGNTLLLISIDPVYGPYAQRLQNQFFKQTEVNWGSLGGVRSWSENGSESSEGEIYLFGQADTGILLARVAVTHFENRGSYTYWNGERWSKDMPPTNATANSFMLDQPIMNMDLFYSPAHRTFIMIYLTPEADNTFYYRYLLGKDGYPLNIILPDRAGGDTNYVENLLTKTWSDEKVLFVVPTPERGYAYAGGIHAGYFGSDDITQGGLKMLCTWTEHTNVDSIKPESGYAHKSQVLELDWEEG